MGRKSTGRYCVEVDQGNGDGDGLDGLPAGEEVPEVLDLPIEVARLARQLECRALDVLCKRLRRLVADADRLAVVVRTVLPPGVRPIVEQRLEEKRMGSELDL